jgi:hypothetical protein
MIDNRNQVQGTRSEPDVKAAVAVELRQCRELIGGEVRRRINEYAVAIELQNDKQHQFETDIIEALLWCVVAQADAPNRKRYGDIRKQLACIKGEAVAAQKHLERLRFALNDLPPRYSELLNTQLESVTRIAVAVVAKQMPWFYALSPLADTASIISEALRNADKGGAPAMLTFRTLIAGLRRAFARAKGKNAGVTWNEHRKQFEGKFLKLVEAVLPLAMSFSSKERPMRIPKTSNARGKYVYEMTRRGRPQTRNA